MNNECTNVLPFVILLFIVSLAGSNFASWRMEKHLRTKKSVTDVSKWKLLLSRISELESQELLTKRGMLWRKANIWLLAATVVSAIAFALLRTQSWVCEIGTNALSG